MNCTALRDEYTPNVIVRTTLFDVTEIKRANDAVRESEERFRQLYEAAFEGLAIHESGRILEVNEAMAAMFGYARDEMVGMSPMDLIAPDSSGAPREFSFADSPGNADAPHETVGIRRNGTTFSVEMRGKSIPYRGRTVLVTAMQDLQDRKRAQDQSDQHREELAHVLRLSTMGEMATGLAHELNQPLAAIVSYTQGSVRRLQSGGGDIGEVVTAIESAAKQAQRAGEIIKRLREQVRKREPKSTPVDINALVRNASEVLGGEAKRSRVTLRLQLTDHLPVVLADSVQIEQVVINLVKNACEAVCDGEAADRNVWIQTRNTPDNEVEVLVRDAGPGLTAGAAKRAFEPFFTTKVKGMGMGLSISRSIIEAHGGRIQVQPNDSGGVTFSFSLPITA